MTDTRNWARFDPRPAEERLTTKAFFPAEDLRRACEPAAFSLFTDTLQRLLNDDSVGANAGSGDTNGDSAGATSTKPATAGSAKASDNSAADTTENSSKADEIRWMLSIEAFHQTIKDPQQLPGIFVTAPALNSENEIEGRTVIYRYDGQTPDDDGMDALYYGVCYYREAMEHQAPGEETLRLQCFQAAELLYLHAAARGNVMAFCNLGYIYSYRRCQGNYLPQCVLTQAQSTLREHVGKLSEETLGVPLGKSERTGLGEQDGVDADRAGKAEELTSVTFSPGAAAYCCYLYAAEIGEPESMYKVGDLLLRRHDPDSRKKALSWYRQSFQAGSEYEVIWGGAALRLAQCIEEDATSPKDLEEAREWYRLAVAGLQAAVNAGDWYYERQLAKAKKGLKRMNQELEA